MEEIKKLAAFAKDKARASSVKELVTLTRNEVKWYSSLFELKESSQKDAESRQHFNDWLHNFMVTGYMFDSLLDMEKDFRSGNITVVPSLGNKKALAGVAMREIIRSVKKTPPRRLGSIAYIAYRNVHPPKQLLEK